MNMQRKSILYLLILSLSFGFIHLTANPALACSCTSPPTDAALKNSDVVFSGRVVGIKYLDDPQQRNPEPRTVVTFKVFRSWKGVSTQEFVLHTVDNHWTCQGYYFREGKDYLVFAFRHNAESAKRLQPYKLPEKSWGVSLCGRTKLLSEAAKDLEILGEGSTLK